MGCDGRWLITLSWQPPHKIIKNNYIKSIMAYLNFTTQFLIVWAIDELRNLYFSTISSSYCGCTSRIIFVWPAFFDSASLHWSLNLQGLCSFHLQLHTRFLKSIYTNLKSKIYFKQEVHLQLIQLICTYSSHFCIVGIVKESAQPCQALL